MALFTTNVQPTQAAPALGVSTASGSGKSVRSKWVRKGAVLKVGGAKSASEKSRKFLLTPTFFFFVGDKYCLDIAKSA